MEMVRVTKTVGAQNGMALDWKSIEKILGGVRLNKIHKVNKALSSAMSQRIEETGGSNDDPGRSTVKRHYYLYKGNKKAGYLTHREAQCMFLALRGYRYEEIGALLGISFRTVEDYMRKAKMRLHCKSRTAFMTMIMGSDFNKLYLIDELFESSLIEEISTVSVTSSDDAEE